jgi:hypothetical protein
MRITYEYRDIIPFVLLMNTSFLVMSAILGSEVTGNYLTEELDIEINFEHLQTVLKIWILDVKDQK